MTLALFGAAALVFLAELAFAFLVCALLRVACAVLFAFVKFAFLAEFAFLALAEFALVLFDELAFAPLSALGAAKVGVVQSAPTSTALAQMLKAVLNFGVLLSCNFIRNPFF